MCPETTIFLGLTLTDMSYVTEKKHPLQHARFVIKSIWRTSLHCSGHSVLEAKPKCQQQDQKYKSDASRSETGLVIRPHEVSDLKTVNVY